MYPDLLKAAELYQKACDQGMHPQPSCTVAWTVFRETMAIWVAFIETLHVSSSGHAMAQYTLGKQCMSGRGIPQDAHKAIGTPLFAVPTRPFSVS
jgi:TPR repeat protein